MSDSIVVTGWGMVTPLGFNSDLTWKHLMAGDAARQTLGGREWKGFEFPRAAQVLDAETPGSLSRRDRSLRFGVMAAEEAWSRSGLSQVDPGRIATTFSSSKGGMLSLLSAMDDPLSAGDFLTDFFPHTGGCLLQQRLKFSGPALSFSSACSTGIVSIAQGIRLLEDGECDAVLTGSTEASIHPLIYAGFQNMGVLSDKPEGPSSFDVSRDGFLMGEGASVMVLEREEPARQRKAPILVRLSGWSLGADAYGSLEMEPNGKTIIPVIQRALRKAGLKPDEIGYINAHGTGTRLNDAVESKALFEIFGDKKVWVSSTKGATGHLLGAAGSVEAVLTAMVLTRGEIPDTRNLNFPDPDCRVRHVEKGGLKQKVDHVLSLSYGFGGQLGAVIFSRV
jgi:3-oxoacyl-[acyl-carrier-protein] synthase II